MKKMGIQGDTPITLAVELNSKAYAVFRQIGMCCINEENENWTVEELCAHHGVEVEELLAYLETL